MFILSFEDSTFILDPPYVIHFVRYITSHYITGTHTMSIICSFFCQHSNREVFIVYSPRTGIGLDLGPLIINKDVNRYKGSKCSIKGDVIN